MVELVDAEAANARLNDVSARPEADTIKARIGFESCNVRVGEVEQASKLATASMDNAWKQSVEWDKTAEEAPRQLMEVSSLVQFLDGEQSLLKTQMSECCKTVDDAASSVTKQRRHSRMLEACIDLLKDKPNLIKRKDLTGCNMEVVCYKVAATKGGLKELAGGFCRDTAAACACIWHNVDQSLLVVSNRPNEMFDREEKVLQLVLHDAL